MEIGELRQEVRRLADALDTDHARSPSFSRK